MRVCPSRGHSRRLSRWLCQSPRQPIASPRQGRNRLARERSATAEKRVRIRRGVPPARIVGRCRQTSAMTDPFLGSQALAAGELTRYELRSRYVALHQGVYVLRGAELTPALRAKACWLRSRRRGILAGFSASALHGARWIDPSQPATLIDTNRRRAVGVQVWEERIEADEIGIVDEMRVTTPARTALDLARRCPTDIAVAAIDALAQAVEVKLADIELLIERYRRRRGMKAARAAIELVDGGSQSPKETWLRLLLVRAGFPRPQTQIAVRNEWGWPEAYLDWGYLPLAGEGWEDIKVAVEYDGDQHRSSRAQYVKDIRRFEMLERRGWIVVRIVAEDRREDIIRRVAEARARRAGDTARLRGKRQGEKSSRKSPWRYAGATWKPGLGRQPAVDQQRRQPCQRQHQRT
jgi:AbiEi antitoxin C-terminal domain/Protein of unknown function (DUF559)